MAMYVDARSQFPVYTSPEIQLGLERVHLFSVAQGNVSILELSLKLEMA